MPQADFALLVYMMMKIVVFVCGFFPPVYLLIYEGSTLKY